MAHSAADSASSFFSYLVSSFHAFPNGLYSSESTPVREIRPVVFGLVNACIIGILIGHKS